MDRTIIFVGIGGLVGSILRYVLTLFVAKQVPSAFPYGTLTVNLVGCFLIGVIYALSERGGVSSPEWRLFLTAGFCGGFTTFSAFSYESIKLIQDGQILFAAMYVGVSVIVGFALTFLGLVLFRSV
jgi:CrcB protein